MERMLELGQGLEIWRVHVDEAREQDENAQAMPKAMFERLANTIKGDGRLETLPFCAQVDDQLEIVSGHHRFRAARAAGLSEVYAIVDVTGLSRSAIAAKQLAHNSISGESDAQIVKRIFEKIDDVRLKLEAFIDPEKIGFKLDRVSVGQLQVGIMYESVIINFFPVERERFNQALAALETRMQGHEILEMHVSVLENFDRFRSALAGTKQAYEIRSTGTALDQMARIALETLGEDTGDTDDDTLPLRSVFGTSVLPAPLAKKLKARIKKMMDDGTLDKKEPWRALELLLS